MPTAKTSNVSPKSIFDFFWLNFVPMKNNHYYISNNVEKQVTQKRTDLFVKGLNKCFERKVFVLNENFETQNIFIYLIF